MRRRLHRGTFARMTLWMLTIVICTAAWVLGSAVVVLGATWLVRHEPH